MRKFSKINESNNLSTIDIKDKIKSEIQGDKYQMVSGIIDILKKVKDIENRMEIATDMVEQFKREGIEFDYGNFFDCVK